ncbi:3610_t:CDS:2 [Cetraspora pellucida]|uniref:3610_t:CDS:1 n=1 Tax=Cetraspora pellucida TaxID=1433469 RepID=A0ACA9KE59_9GLOM|nr:3610_t:CDS:2 [Cetraspora pellucida]
MNSDNKCILNKHIYNKYVYNKYNIIQEISDLFNMFARRKNNKEFADQPNPKKVKHKILSPDEKLYTNPDKKHQLQLDKIVKKATSHHVLKKTKLKRVTTK